MVDLVQILKDSGIGDLRKGEEIKVLIATAIGQYLETNDVISSLDVKDALRQLTEERVIMSSYSRKDETTRPVRPEDHWFYNTFYRPTGNPNIRLSTQYKHVKLENALTQAKEKLQERHPDCEISITCKHNGDNVPTLQLKHAYLYFRNQQKMETHLLDMMQIRKTVVTYDEDF